MEARRRFLILSGPTREYLDPVRYLSNASSGRQGVALAEEALRRGHDVDLVQGPVGVDPPRTARVFPVVSTEEMRARALEFHPLCDVVIGAAAVTDYRPAKPLQSKRKRDGEKWLVELVPNPDILRELGKRKAGKLHVGFALETEDLIPNGRRKLVSKNLDWIVANSTRAIGAELGQYILLGADGTTRDLGELSKEKLAAALLDVIEGSL